VAQTFSFRHQLGDRRVLVTNRQRMPPASPGYETHGYYCRNTISLKPTMRGREALNVLVHEALHALFPWMAEDVVDLAADQLVDLLLRPEFEFLIWECL
jgi:hypothetical protein